MIEENNLILIIITLPYLVISVTSGAGTAYPSGAPEFTPGF
jgi:hypothetical protein